MRLYDVYCPQCGWKSNLPVEEAVKVQLEGKTCRECHAKKKPDSRFCFREHLSVGPYSKFLPAKGGPHGS